MALGENNANQDSGAGRARRDPRAAWVWVALVLFVLYELAGERLHRAVDVGFVRIAVAAVGLVLGPGILAGVVYVMSGGGWSAAKPGDRVMAIIGAAFGAFATWVFFFK